MSKKDEYLMLREEILHLDKTVSNMISFFYATLSAYMAFVLDQKDSIYFILPYISIIPTYLITLRKLHVLCKIGAYLYVFHEKNDDNGFKWEKRNMEYMASERNEKEKRDIFSYVTASNFPFLFATIATIILFLYKTNWNNFPSVYECSKLIICVILNFLLLSIMFKNRIITTESCVRKWNNIK